MTGKINECDFLNSEAQRYWSFPSSYDEAKRRETLNNLLYSGDYMGSEKKDGYWQMVLKDEDGNLFMRARAKGVNGWVCKQEWVPQFNSFFDSLPNGTCLICEVYLPGSTSKGITTILGCKKEKAIQRQEENGYLRLYIFDILAYAGENLYKKPIIARIPYLDIIIKELAQSNPYIDIAEYWTDPVEIHDNWLRILAEGGEGVVITRKDNPYEFGKRGAKHTLKMKKELQETVDVFLTGVTKEATMLYTGKDIENWKYWYDEIKQVRVEGTLGDRINNDSLIPVTRLWYNNMAGAAEYALIINNEVTPIGWISGLADEDRLEMVAHPEKYKGRVLELQAMEVDNSGAYPTFRHAKMLRWRPDKEWKECVWNG